jgi:tRNA(Ile)-lysidine synthetase-like protein
MRRCASWATRWPAARDWARERTNARGMSTAGVTSAAFDGLLRAAAAEGAALAGVSQDARAALADVAGGHATDGRVAAPPLVVAVSGGPDSIALGALAARWCRARRWRCVWATVDHGLRPESGAEAAGVSAAAAAAGAHGHCVARLHWPGGPPSSGNLEAVARQRRYEALAGVCHALGAGVLLTAHHAGDQAETALLRFGRASGVVGLASMAAAAASPAHGWVLLRPLLSVDKAALVATAAATGLPVATDTISEHRRGRGGGGGSGGGATSAPTLVHGRQFNTESHTHASSWAPRHIRVPPPATSAATSRHIDVSRSIAPRRPPPYSTRAHTPPLMACPAGAHGFFR